MHASSKLATRVHLPNGVSPLRIFPSRNLMTQRTQWLPSLPSILSNSHAMETQLRRTPLHRRMLVETSPPPPSSPLHKQGYEEYEEEGGGDLYFLLKPTGWFVQLIAFQLEAISSAFFSFLSMISESLRRAEEAKESAEEAVHTVPTRVARGIGLILRKLGFGVLGASYACLVLVLVFVVSVLVGVGLVRLWVEEPVFVREPLHFDFTEAHPIAAMTVRGRNKRRAIPAGHTFHVSVMLLMPESDFNRQIGVFQLTAEVISTTGDILAKSSQPCILRFRSLPVRLMRTLVFALPLLMGISSETQEVMVKILSHKEENPKTQAIRIRLKPRAGTTAVPELYTAEIVVNSQLPWSKQVVHNWKWTLYVWASLYVYTVFLMILVVFKKPVIFPMMGVRNRNQVCYKREHPSHGVEDQQSSLGDSSDQLGSEVLRKWRQRREKRKALLLTRVVLLDPGDEGSASSVTKEETGEEVDDSSELGTLESELSST